MHRKTLVLASLIAALSLGGCAASDGAAGMKMASAPAATQPATAPSAAVDVRNTVCPVSGEKVGDSKLVEVYEGKVYHMCCADCHTDFEKDPAKYAKAVAADPAKFGVK